AAEAGPGKLGSARPAPSSPNLRRQMTIVLLQLPAAGGDAHSGTGLQTIGGHDRPTEGRAFQRASCAACTQVLSQECRAMPAGGCRAIQSMPILFNRQQVSNSRLKSFRAGKSASQQSAMTSRGQRCSVVQCPPFPAGKSLRCRDLHHACKSFFKRRLQLSLSYNCMRRPRHAARSASEAADLAASCRFKKCLKLECGQLWIGHAAKLLWPEFSNHRCHLNKASINACCQKPSGWEFAADQPVRDQPQAETGNADDTPDLEAVQVDLSGRAPPRHLVAGRVIPGRAGCAGQSDCPAFDGILDDRVALLQQHWLDVIVLQVRSPLAVVGYADPDRIDHLQRRHILALALACPCPVRRAKILQLSGAVSRRPAARPRYFDALHRVLNLEGQVPPPLAGEALRNSFSSA
uniref:Nuclear receptor domain-containing protein n=1 Tax=Macrostomum lignano TaxID=282301 RepID=A0A1I8FDV9_9PLAT